MLSYCLRFLRAVSLHAAGILIFALTLSVQTIRAAVKFKLTSPLDYQVVQRTSTAQGDLVVEGQWLVLRGETERPDAAQVRVTRNDDTQASLIDWAPLPFDPRVRGFRASLALPAGGWYRLSVRLHLGKAWLAPAEVAHVGIGEVFVIAGQSNSANHGEEIQHPASGMVVAFDGEHWAIANDPQLGASGQGGSFIPSFGDALFERLHVPIGVVCSGVGSTSVREWLPAGSVMSKPPTTGAHSLVVAHGKFVSSGELFNRLVERLRQFPPQGVRAVLWHQGESDWNQAPEYNLPASEFRDDLATLIAASRTAAGWNVPWIVAQASYHSPKDPGADEFRALQRSVADGRVTFVGPNTDELTGQLREHNGQGVHFSAEGQRRHGQLWAEWVGHWIAGENASPGDTTK